MYNNPMWSDEIIEKTKKLERKVAKNVIINSKRYCPKCGTITKEDLDDNRCNWCGNKLEKY